MQFTRISAVPVGAVPQDARPHRHRRRWRTAAMVVPAGLIVFTTGCYDEEGSGDLVTFGYDDFSDPEITGVSVLDDMDVTVTVDPTSPQSAAVRIDDNLVDRGYATIDDGTLTIAFDGLGEIEPSQTPVVDLTINSIDVIENHGDGDLTVSGVDGGALDVVNSDAGTITVSGTADAVELSSTSSGSVDLAQLVARRVELSDTDDGHIEVHATDTIEGEISGDADVLVHGGPAVTDVEVEDSAELAVA
jgi:Putative auto-transporter adhesin, head GIN domain